MTASTVLSRALDYVKRGWAPLPVVFRGKAPHGSIAKGWQKRRLAAADLLKHFGTAPVNVGVILGDASNGLCDIDLDCVETIQLADSFLPPTASVFGRRTKPRSHRLYVTSQSSATTQFQDIDRSMLVEIRANGSQTVFPGSVHLSGEPIDWQLDGQPAQVEHDQLTRTVGRLAAAALLARHWPAEGGRHEAALALVGWLAASGWTPSEIGVFVRAVADAAGDDEESHRTTGVESTFERLRANEPVTGRVHLAAAVGESVIKLAAEWLGIKNERAKSERPSTSPNRVRRRRAYEQFPVDRLPEPLRSFVLEHGESLGCDAAYLAVPMLGVIASAIGNSRSIRLKHGWTEPAVVWAAVVAPSGTMKSPALDAVISPLRVFENGGLREYHDAVASWKRRKAEYKRDLKEFTDGEADEPPDEPEQPKPKRFMCDDTTIEAIAVVLSDNPRGGAVIRDELSGWLRGFNQYRGGRGGDEAHWLAAHGSRPITIDRKTGGRPYIHIPRAAVSIVGGIQPGVLGTALTSDHMQSGMAARLLFAYPPKRAKKWTDAEASDWTKDDYRRVLENLYRLEPTTAENGVLSPIEIGLTPEAKAVWIEFYNEHANEEVALTGNAAAAWSKLEGYAARLALLVHCVRQVHGDSTCGADVDVTSIAAGITLSRWFGNEALRVYEMLQCGDDNRELNDRLDVVAALGGRVSVREWHRKRKASSADVARAELDALVTAGFGVWEHAVPSTQGGRPQSWFVLKPGDETTLGEESDEDSSPNSAAPESGEGATDA